LDSDGLATPLAQAISKSLSHSLNYLYRLKSRREKVGFKPDDPLHAKVKAADNPVFDLSIDLSAGAPN
jgi:hypothetical protein